MAQTLTRLLVHIVYSTKNRNELILPAVEADLHRYIGGICRNLESPALGIGGTLDHVHLLVGLSKSTALSQLVMVIKKESSKWIKTKDASLRRFGWQDGYGAFTIGQSQVDPLLRYFRRQKEHHKKISFQDEFRALVLKYEVEFDERYVWG